MKSYITLIILVLALSACTTQERTTPVNEEVIPEGSSSEETTPTPEVEGITKEEYLQHNSKNDCWVLYESEVYNVTSYIPKHPGGEKEIIDYCGSTQFEAAFLDEHGTKEERKLYRESILIGPYLD